MALRLPSARSSVRRVSRTRRTLTVLFAASVFVVLPLRLILAALSVATWTSGWRTVDTMSTPFLILFRPVGVLDRTVVGHAQLADFVALIAFAGLAIYLLALLTVRRAG